MRLLDVEFDKVVNLNTSLCIEIVGSRLRVLQFDSAKKNVYNLRFYAEMTFAADQILDGVVLNPVKVGTELAKLISKPHPRLPTTDNVVFLIPQEQSFFITMELPGVSKDELRSIIGNRIGELLPMEVKDVYWDWHRIATVNNKTRTQLAAVSRKTIDSYMQTLQAAKLNPLLFIPREVAAASLLGTIDAELTNTCLLLDAKPGYIILTVVVDNEVVFSSNVVVGTGSVRANSRLIIQNMATAVRYCLGENKPLAEVPILVHGSTGDIENLVSTLQAEKLKASPILYKIEDQDTQSYLDEANKAEYIALMGGAVRGLGQTDPNHTSINLVPDTAKIEYRRNQLSQVLKRYLALLLIDIALLAILGFFVTIWLNGQLLQAQERREASLRVSESERINEVQTLINKLNLNTAETKKVIGSLFNWDALLEELTAITPTGVIIESLSAEQDPLNVTGDYWVFSVSGVAALRQDVLQMADRMRDSKLYTNVVVPLGSLETGTNVDFTIEAQVKFKALLQP